LKTSPDWESVWDEPHAWLIPALRDDLINDPEHLSVYVAYAYGLPVSAAWISFHEHSQFAGLWGGSTLAAYPGWLYGSLAMRCRSTPARRAFCHRCQS
jgi:hypothetical protein